MGKESRDAQRASDSVTRHAAKNCRIAVAKPGVGDTMQGPNLWRSSAVQTPNGGHIAGHMQRNAPVGNLNWLNRQM